MADKNTVSRKPKPIVKVIGPCLIALILAGAVEIGSYFALRFVAIPADPSLVYVPPVVDQEIYEKHQGYRHPILGWATQVEGKYSVVHESRPNLMFPNTDVSCVSTYGDSFTYGSEVSDADAWGNVLSELLDCKVSNFGINGYGTDQAYLRYTLNDIDTAPINILGIYPLNLLRNLNQYRPFLAGKYASSVGLKPRFIIENEDLKLIPPPHFGYDELVSILDTPSNSFPHETFIPGSKYGSVLFKFPYSLNLFRVITSKKVLNHFTKRPSYAHFLDEHHPTNAIPIVEMILEKFITVAEERNHQPLVLLYPSVSSYEYYKRTNTLATQDLADVLKRNNIESVDMHMHFSEYLGERAYCEILVNPDSCTGHYTPEGNRVVATALAHKHKLMN